MRKTFPLLAALLLTACGPDRQVREDRPSDNGDYTPSVLFTVDGCTVYRFVDKSEYVYFTRCDRVVRTTHMDLQQRGKVHVTVPRTVETL